MVRRKILFGVGAGIVSLGVDGLSNILILRILTSHLPVAQAGYWILVTSAGSLLLLLQCGMGPTIARAVATTLATSGSARLGSLLGAVRIAFSLIASIVVFAATAIFFCYLQPTGTRAHLELPTLLAWFPYALGMAANLQGQASLFILNGYGEVGWDKVLRSVFTTAGFVVVWLALTRNAGLMALGLIYLTQNLLFWATARWKLRSFLDASTRPAPAEPGQVSLLFRDGSKLLLLNLLTFLITQFTIFVVERNFGLDQVAGYSAMLRVGVLIGTIGSLLPQMLYPYMARAWSERDFARCRRYYLTGIAVSVATALLLSLPLLVFGREIFALWLGSKVTYVAPAFAGVLAFYLLYVHHGAHATPALAVAGTAFTIPALVNAGMVMILVLSLPRYLGLPGVPWGMILGTLPASVYVVAKSWNIIMRRPTAEAAKLKPA